MRNQVESFSCIDGNLVYRIFLSKEHGPIIQNFQNLCFLRMLISEAVLVRGQEGLRISVMELAVFDQCFKDLQGTDVRQTGH